MNVFLICIFMIALTYMIFILWVMRSMQKLMETALPEHPSSLSVSVIIPFRNEETSLPGCLDSLEKLNLEGIKAEFVFIDDHSEDEGPVFLSQNFRNQDFRLINSKGIGKKNALLTGIEAAQFSTIFTIDADCYPEPNWLKVMAQQYVSQNLKMLCGPIVFHSEGVFSGVQAAESAALVGVSAAMLHSGRPSTCNGANLMFDKEAFWELGAYGGKDAPASGDDDLLMQKFYKHYPDRVDYTLNPEARIWTKPETKLNAFIHQRARWLSKRKKYIYPYNQYLHVLLLLKWLVFWASLILGVAGFYSNKIEFVLLIITFLLLYLADFLLSIPIKKLSGSHSSVWGVQVLQLYLIPALIFSFVGKIEWKGRKI